MKYATYHALGNVYVVLRPADLNHTLGPNEIERICHRHFGVGSDGILLGPLPSGASDFRLQLFNPDGSEAEKSGNGLRISARFLWDKGLVRQDPFSVETLGGPVTCRVAPGGKTVTVEMGQVSFDSAKIPVVGSPPRQTRRNLLQ